MDTEEKIARKKPIKFSTWIENTKNIVESVAFISAGLWVLFTFIIKDRPSLEHRLKTGGEIIFSEYYSDRLCHINMISTLENIGQTGVDISKVKVYGWISGRFVNTNDSTIKSINYDRIQKEIEPFYKETYDIKDIEKDTTLAMIPQVGHMSPGVTTSFDLNFIAERKEAKWILFLIEYYEDDILATSSWVGSPMCAPPSITLDEGSGN